MFEYIASLVMPALVAIHCFLAVAATMDYVTADSENRTDVTGFHSLLYLGTAIVGIAVWAASLAVWLYGFAWISLFVYHVYRWVTSGQAEDLAVKD